MNILDFTPLSKQVLNVFLVCFFIYVGHHDDPPFNTSNSVGALPESISISSAMVRFEMSLRVTVQAAVGNCLNSVVLWLSISN